MKVGIIGTGYVGLPTGVGLAELGHRVICIDRDARKIETLNTGNLTIYEDGLADLLAQNVASGRLSCTTSMAEGIADADVVLIAVGTPPDPVTHAADMQYIHAAARELAPHLTGYTVVAIKSTVPVGTGDAVEKIIAKVNPTADFDMVSLPEFLREGFAIHDFFHPDRIVVGANTDRAADTIRRLYESFADKTNILFVRRRSSEAIKYASNAFLAVKIHYINEMADFCEKAGADVAEVARGMGLDSRIGPRFLNAGPGYGGSCFPKDTMAMAYMGRQVGVPMTLIENTITQNAERKKKMADRILNAVRDIPNAKIAALGLAFKNGTDDCRESPAIEIIKALLERGADVTVYDPRATANARYLLGDRVHYTDDMYAPLAGADVLTLLTEWDDFKALDLKRAADLMRHKRIMDCRNLLDPATARANGFEYHRIGQADCV